MKTLLVIALAIAHCRPSLPKTEVDAYAAIVEKRSVAIGDPLLIVALGKHESGWIQTAVNKKSGALGIGQILPQFRPACAKDPTSAVCSTEKKKLLDGVYNLSAVFDGIEAWQRECLKKTGSSSEVAWLSSYAGLNNMKTGKWCGRQQKDGKWVQLPQHRLVKEVFAMRRNLQLWLEGIK